MTSPLKLNPEISAQISEALDQMSNERVANWLALAERAQKATKGSYDLDADMALAIGWCQGHVGSERCWYDRDQRMQAMPFKWSRSLDAMIALIEQELPGHGYSIRRGDRFITAHIWRFNSGGGEAWAVDGATPALALVEAFCRAKHEMEKNNASN